MTFETLEKIIVKNNIPKNVLLQSDSGWECCETEMDGVYYNRKANKIIFTQDVSIYDDYYINLDFEPLYPKISFEERKQKLRTHYPSHYTGYSDKWWNKD